MRVFRGFKVYAQVAGKRVVERQAKEKIQTEVQQQVHAAKLQNEFVESMIKELEEQYRIELRKKTILKN